MTADGRWWEEGWDYSTPAAAPLWLGVTTAASVGIELWPEVPALIAMLRLPVSLMLPDGQSKVSSL